MGLKLWCKFSTIKAAIFAALPTVLIFGIWALLILAALALSKGLSAAMREEDEGDPGQGGQTGGPTEGISPAAAPRDMPDLGPDGPR